MSQASDMMAEVKSHAAELEKELKSFEKQVEPAGGQFTNLLHLNKAKIHLGLLLDELRSRRGNVEDAELAELEAQENAPATPEPASAPVAAEPAPVAAPEPIAAPEAAAVDPAAGLVAKPDPAPEHPAG